MLVFDDDPIESILYDDVPIAPSSASIFAKAHELFEDLESATAQGEYELAFSITSRLWSGDVQQPAQMQLKVHQLLVQAISDARLFADLSREAKEAPKWRVLGELVAISEYADGVMQQALPEVAVAACLGERGASPFILDTLFELNLMVEPNRRRNAQIAPVLGDARVTDGIKSLAKHYRSGGDDAALFRLTKLVTGVLAVSEAAGFEHLCLSACLNGLTRAVQDAGEHEAAEVLGRRALEIRRKAVGDHHRLVLQSLNNLGLSLVCLGQLEEAEQLLVEATSGTEPFPNPFYWLARLYKERASPGDQSKEHDAWGNYLTLGGTTEERIREARTRMAQLEPPSM